MQDSAPLPSVECPEHYVQFPHESPEPYLLPQILGDIETRASSGSSTPERLRTTVSSELVVEKEIAIWRRELLRCCVQKAGLSHDLGGELCEDSTDQRYWLERGHYFAREQRTIEHRIKVSKETGDIQYPTYREIGSPFSLESRKKGALKLQSEFLAEARSAGITFSFLSDFDKSSGDTEYWYDEMCFYINETQAVKQMARKLALKAAKERAMRPPSPPKVLSSAEKETMANNKQLAKEHREKLRYWVEKAELEVLDLGDLDESCYDPEYWRIRALFYIEETLRVKWDYRIKNMKVRGHFNVETDPETGKRYVEDFVMYDEEDCDLRHMGSPEYTPKPKAHKSRATKSRLPRKAKPSQSKAKQSKHKTSRAGPASRGAVSKKSRAASPISSRLRSKARPVP